MTNWFKVMALILLGVIIGVTVERYLLPQPIQDITPYCMDWVRAMVANARA